MKQSAQVLLVREFNRKKCPVCKHQMFWHYGRKCTYNVKECNCNNYWTFEQFCIEKIGYAAAKIKVGRPRKSRRADFGKRHNKRVINKE